MNQNYRQKYLKYKTKYLELKQLVAGSKNIIHNFHNNEYELAIAEVIPHGTLSEIMTSHGLGSGIYGFINIAKNKNYISNHIETKFNIENPVILSKKRKSDNDDLGNFTWLSTRLNILCYNLYTDNLDINRSNIEKIFSKNYLYLNDNGTYDGIPNNTVTIDDIIFITQKFINDYKLLMTTEKTDENYILMPINYLLYYKKYDGVFNNIGDDASSGSVKYFFMSEHRARGYRPTYKKRLSLKCSLIFSMI